MHSDPRSMNVQVLAVLCALLLTACAIIIFCSLGFATSAAPQTQSDASTGLPAPQKGFHGLAWKNPDGSWGGPVGQTVAKAIEEGYASRSEPFHGYYFKSLMGQGPAAPHGELDYVINGVMIGGFALVAWPADYGITGVKTFVVSYNGIVYQKDLGAETVKIAAAMERYNPDKTWLRTNDNW